MVTNTSSATATARQWSAKPNEPLLRIDNLCVDYLGASGAVRAVNHVSFEIGHGEIFGLAGESGCGKSTIAQAILRILRPPALITSGHIVFDGEDVLDMTEQELRTFRWREVAMVFQSAMNALNPVLTIGAQISDVLKTHQPWMTRKEVESRAAELLDIVGIEASRLRAYPHQLSGGMRQRVVIAIALALQPRLLIMDEPTTALDVVVQKDILQQIERLKQEFDLAILFITHDLSLMVELADRIGIMYAGQLVELTDAQTLFNQPMHPYTQGLMNSFPSLTGPKEALLGIPGTLPDLLRPPSGCRFHPRCSKAHTACLERQPDFREVELDHWTACHLY